MVSTRPATDFIGLADALSNTERNGATAPLNSALGAYIYALANLGAATNHHESAEIVKSLDQLVEATGGTVETLCYNA